MAGSAVAAGWGDQSGEKTVRTPPVSNGKLPLGVPQRHLAGKGEAGKARATECFVITSETWEGLCNLKNESWK